MVKMNGVASRKGLFIGLFLTLTTVQVTVNVDAFHHQTGHRYYSLHQRSRFALFFTKQHNDLHWFPKTTSSFFHKKCKQSRSHVITNALQFPLIDPLDTWGNVSILCFSATLAQILGKTTSIGKLLGPPVTAMALSFFLASVGISNPGGTQVSKSIQLLSLSFATPLMLLGADLQNCVSRCGPLLPTFIAASFATTMACIVGWLVSGQQLMTALGKDGIIIAAGLMAKNIGGGINYIAVCRCLSASPQAIAAGLVVDNIFALLYFPATSALSSGMSDVKDGQNSDAHSLVLEEEEQDAQEQVKNSQLTTKDTSQSVFQICNLLFLASTLLWLGEKFGGMAGALPCCTLFTLLFALIAPKKWIQQLQKPAEILGTACLYLFFATAGAPGVAIADSVRTSLLPLSLFLSCLYGIHFLILWSLYRIGNRRSPSFVPQMLLVASSAAIGGPATACALAQANDWHSLIVPSLLVGNIGYAIATFCGLAFANFFGN